ncbi:MAG: bifunctional demethylmenaquinone methyltransferase/2-methoxy-6-polyprenyl-1,4-benzoquinol methylase UbiE [Holosporaceae bacterium]|nr:MAG: bifunctional demethylmenaquinone methyltransferase/2-methoxy-6-polyprenyl-1,4-benzoquinol methylase UbiE [Holosporaceae bacterium]
MINTEKIKKIFDHIPGRYDLMNDLMSLGMHRQWKRHFVQQIPQQPNIALLDLAAGTGDIAYAYGKKSHSLSPTITLYDQSPQMLQKAKDRQIDENIIGNFSWVEGSSEKLPFKDNIFDVCTVSFGFRNFSDQEKSLTEIHRVLKPGGQFLCLEFSQPDPDIHHLYRTYLLEFIPRLGKFITENKEAYTYLAESIRDFPDAPTVQSMLQQAQFKSVVYESLTKGIVAIHKGWKKND